MIWILALILGCMLGIGSSRAYRYYLEQQMWAEVKAALEKPPTTDQYYWTFKEIQNGRNNRET